MRQSLYSVFSCPKCLLVNLVWSDLVWSEVFRYVCPYIYSCKEFHFFPLLDIQTQQLTSPNDTQKTVRSAVWSIHISVDIYANVKRCCLAESKPFFRQHALSHTPETCVTKRRICVQLTEGSAIVIQKLLNYVRSGDSSIYPPSLELPTYWLLRNVSIGLPK